MDEENYNEYDGNQEHDCWVDFTYHENTGELKELFDEDE